MKKVSSLLLGALGVTFLAGCGGGGGSSSGPSGGDGTLPLGPGVTHGPIEARGQIKGTPIIRDLSGISTIALAGVVTDGTYRPQGPPDNETAITLASSNYLDLFFEDGEPIVTLAPTYNGTTLTPAYPRWTPDGSRIYFLSQDDVYYVTPSSSVATRVLTDVGYRFDISPNGTKLVFARVPSGESDREIYTSTLSGTSVTRVTTNTVDDTPTMWVGNDRIIAYSAGDTVVYNLNGTLSATYNPINTAPVASTPDGRYFFNYGSDISGYAFSVSQREGLGFTRSNYYETDQFMDIYDAGSSPNGQRWVYFEEGRVSSTELFPQYISAVRGEGAGGYLGGDWQPALGVTKFVGSGGKLGSTSAGIIATYRTGNARNGLSSFVNWDCQTRSTSTVSDDATDSEAGAKTYAIEADRLTALRYGNYPLFNNISTVSVSGTANGAFVTVEAQDGKVSNIVIYQETRGAKPTIRKQGSGKVIEGAILGVWNAKGENLAPNGAARVTLSDKGEPTVE
ncbi:hypothetical protein EON79_11825 [bacterium]|nr:MAG: hypothetical protein EON79_11825 [bacterium]